MSDQSPDGVVGRTDSVLTQDALREALIMSVHRILDAEFGEHEEKNTEEQPLRNLAEPVADYVLIEIVARRDDALRDALRALADHRCRVCRETMTRHAETFRAAKLAAGAPDMTPIADIIMTHLEQMTTRQINAVVRRASAFIEGRKAGQRAKAASASEPEAKPTP